MLFSVYPGKNGEALESLRLIVFNEALQDMRALKLCEKYYSKDTIIKEIEKIYGGNIVFSDCVHSSDVILNIRKRINEMIKEKTQGNIY